MAEIKKYLKQDGSTAYMFNIYLGVDPLTGKKKRTTRRGFKTAKQAKHAIAQIELGIDKPAAKAEARKFLTFKSIYELWFDQYKNTIKEITAKRTQSLFDKHILPVLGDLNIKKIEISHCQSFVNNWAKYFKNFSTLKAYAQKIFDFAITQKLITENPMRLVIMPKRKVEIEDVKKDKFLDLQELKSFFTWAEQSCKEQEIIMFKVLASTGLRKGELQALTWDSIDFVNSTLTVSRTMITYDKKIHFTTPKTKGSNRTITIDESICLELKKWKIAQKKALFKEGVRARNNKEQLIFCNPLGGPLDLSFLNRSLSKYKQKKLTPHSFRHTHTSLLFEAGASTKEVQIRLGHSDITTTLNIYAHVSKSHEKETAKKFANYVNNYINLE